MMPSLTALRTFYWLVRSGGVAEAAAQLNVTPGAVRHQLRLLEEEFGVPLTQRIRRGLTLTTAGKHFYQKLQVSFAEMEDACRTVGHTVVAGELKIACAPALLTIRLIPVIKHFAARFPAVNLRIFPIDQADNSMDVVISYGERSIAGIRYAILENETYFPVCSPELVYQTPPNALADLHVHALLHSVTDEDWRRLFRAAGHNALIGQQHIYFPNAHLAMQAARDGCGIAIGSTILCAEDLRRGTLRRVLNLEVPAPYPYFVIRPHYENRMLGDAFCEILLDQLRMLGGAERLAGDGGLPQPGETRAAEGWNRAAVVQGDRSQPGNAQVDEMRKDS